MKESPIIRMQIEDLGQKINGMLMADHKAVQEYVNEGIKKAADGIKQTIVDQAAKLAAQQFQKEVENYFQYGEGYRAIKEVVDNAFKEFPKALRKGGK